MRIAVCALVLLAGAAAAEDKPAARELKTQNLRFNFDEGKKLGPVEVTSADELKKAKPLADDAGRDALAKQIDFEKEKLVLFVWGGSGGDKLLAGGDAKEVTFTHTPGLTFDLRQHFRAFAVPKDAKVKLVAAK
jgi:hypothetical protein